MHKSLKILLISISIALGMPLGAIEMNIQPVPKDLVEFTCHEFADHANECTAYECEAPYLLDPTVKTQWKIIGRQNNRCLISDTTENIGLKNYNDEAVPVTRTCEYNEEGIEDLLVQFEDVELGFFRSRSSSKDDGAFNCQFTTKDDKPITQKDYQKSMREESAIQQQ